MQCPAATCAPWIMPPLPAQPRRPGICPGYASGQVRLQPAARSTNAVLHPWLRERLSDILAVLPVPQASLDPAATQAAWAVWQAGLTRPFTLPDDLPPLRLLLVWGNLTGHKKPHLGLGLCGAGGRP